MLVFSVDWGSTLDISLIVLAAVAVFVISRLYAVLGQRTGAEPPPAALQKAMMRAPEIDEPAIAEEDERPRLRQAFTGPAASGLEAIAAADPDFSPDNFTTGARKAYELIVSAFADGDRAALKPLLDEDVYEAYSDAIAQRAKDAGEPMRLVKLRAARIVDASLIGSVARVGMAFEADLSDGENFRTANEKWTFKRDTQWKDPNWLLDEVTAAS